MEMDHSDELCVKVYYPTVAVISALQSVIDSCLPAQIIYCGLRAGRYLRAQAAAGGLTASVKMSAVGIVTEADIEVYTYVHREVYDRCEF